MPISATGSKASLWSRGAGCRVRGEDGQGGFTLLEILLVLIIMVIASALIVPSFFSAASPSPEAAARELSKILRLAVDETALDGRPLLWYATEHSYGFEQLDSKGKWGMMSKQPYAERHLPKGIVFRGIKPADAVATVKLDEKKQPADPVLCRLLLLPSGIEMPAQIVLGSEKHADRKAAVRLQPGPDGIRLADQAP